MSLAIRIEKLRYLAQEIELAFFIAAAQPTDYRRRAMARRVLVRVKDFVNHVAQLSKPLRVAGFDSTELKKRKEIYAEDFEAYYQKQRDRMSAHVQDLDMIERLELWTDIEIQKLSHFVDGAKELYVASLGAVGAPGYQPFTSFPELADPAFTSALEGHAASVPVTQGVTLDVGAFAASIPGTVTTIGGTLLQQRAAQLVTLRQWVEFGGKLHATITSWPNAERILRAQLLTDAVSYADCLVTRVNPPPAQQMTGLDDLVREARGDASAIEDLLRVFRFQQKLTSLRAVRNVVGGHLDDDENVSVATLLAQLDSMPLREILRFYTKLNAAFALTCHRTHFMDVYLKSGVVLTGIATARGPHEFVRPFDSNAPAPETEPLPRRPDYSDESLKLALDGVARGERLARDAMWDAFTASPVVERCERDGSSFEYRTAHGLLLARLVNCRTDEERAPFFALVRSCAGGFPDSLAVVLERCLAALAERGDHSSDAAIYANLGELPLARDGHVRSILTKAVHEHDATAARAAVVALYRVVMHAAERHQNWSTNFFAAHIAPVLSVRPAEERLLICLAIASLFPAGRLHAGEQNAIREMSAIQPAIRAEIGNMSDGVVDKALTNHDYVSLAVWAALKFRGTDRRAEGESILNATMRGEILFPNDIDRCPDALVNFAVACLEAGERERAKRVAQNVMITYPASISHKLRCMHVLLEAGVEPSLCKEMLEHIRDAYELDADTRAMWEERFKSIP